MTPRDWLGRLNRLQHNVWFKGVASAVVLLLAIGYLGYYFVELQRLDVDQIRLIEPPPPPASAGAGPAAEDPQAAAARANAEVFVRSINDLLALQRDPTAMAVGVGLLTAVALTIIWLGLGLTYLALLLITLAAVVPLTLWGGPTSRAIGAFLGASVVLTASFTVLMQALRLLFAGPGAVLAIARNVVLEAVRLKISLVFIVLLIFALAALPGLLDEAQPLRYRVQSFLQYGTGGTFWIIAVLVLFLSTATVSFEQRDRVIWQTMTKPVAVWQYLLGKWIGVIGVAAVLLAVSASGVFLFTEYLRRQPAMGEFTAFVPADGSPVSDDRLVLESQVLAARRIAGPTLPDLDQQRFAQLVNERIESLRRGDPDFADTRAARERIAKELLDEIDRAFFSLGPGEARVFEFRGLERAREAGQPVTLRYRANFGANDPRDVFRVTFYVPGTNPIVHAVPPGQALSIPYFPNAISPDGTLTLEVFNGDWPAQMMNGQTLVFPPDGLEVFYSAGSYRVNFARVAMVLWLKLAMLAMVAIAASTFLSFSVASLVAFGVFLMAETAGFLWESLEYYDSLDSDGNVVPYKLVVRSIAVPVAGAFRYYADLRPTAHLVEGRLVPWSTVLSAAAVLGATTAALYGAGVVIFRRRELATYSGS